MGQLLYAGSYGFQRPGTFPLSPRMTLADRNSFLSTSVHSFLSFCELLFKATFLKLPGRLSPRGDPGKMQVLILQVWERPRGFAFFDKFLRAADGAGLLSIL